MKKNISKKPFFRCHFLKNFNIGPKIIISFSIVISLLLVLVFSSYQIIANSLITQTQENTLQIIKQTSKTIETTLSEIDRLVLSISRNEILGELVSQFDTADQIEKSYLDTKIKQISTSLISTRNDIADIIIITKKGGYFIIPPNNSITSLNYKPFTSYAYRKYSAAKKSSLWLDTYTTDNQGTHAISPKVVTILKDMYISTHVGKIGIIQLNIKETHLNNLIMDVKSASGGDFFVLGSNQNIVLNPQQPSMSEKKIYKKYLEQLTHKKSGFFYTKINHIKNLLVFDKIDRTGWFVIFTIPINNITKNIQNATHNLLIIGLLCALIGITFSFLISQDISGALSCLDQQITSIENGNLDIDLILERNDEFGRLSENFQKMVLGLKTILSSISNNSTAQISPSQANSNPDLNEIINETQAKLRQLVDIDPLTGAYNRRFFEQYYRIELNKLHANLISCNTKETNCYLGIAFVDIDNFKRINDNYGHHIGDLVLKDLVKILMNQLSNYDVVCRYGGEEFVIVFTQTDRETILQNVEKIRKNVNDYHFYLNENILDGHVTISIGVSFFPKDHLLPDHLIEIADKRLYVAKNTGKNKIVFE